MGVYAYAAVFEDMRFMKWLFAFSLFACTILGGLPAAAQSSGGGFYVPGAWVGCPIKTGSPTNCDFAVGVAPHYVAGIMNMDASAQNATVSCTDGTTTVTFAALGSTQQFTILTPGIPVSKTPSGGHYVCTASSAPAGNGLMVQLY